MSTSYDKFEAGRLVDLTPFIFESNRFEVWQNGALIESKTVDQSIAIMTSRSKVSDRSVLHVRFKEPNSVKSLVKTDLDFDTCYFGVGRIIGATVPAKSNIESNASFVSFRSAFRYQHSLTTTERSFQSNEPFACSIFTVKGMPSKITFTNGINDTSLNSTGTKNLSSKYRMNDVVSSFLSIKIKAFQIVLGCPDVAMT